MYEVARAEEGRLQIVCMGPLTNVATAIETYPDFAGMVAGITTTAGFSALDKMPTRDGVTALPVMISEPDLFNDQDAFVKVLGSGIPIKSIGTSTDPTYRLGYTPEKNRENTLDKWLSPDSDYSVTFSRIRQHFKASGKYRDQAAFPSVMAMLSLIDADLLTFEDLPVQQVSFDATDVLLRRADGGEDALGDLQRLTGFADIMAYNDAFFYMPRYYHQYR